MPQMVKQLDLLDYSTAKSLNDVIKIANENNRRIQDAYRKIHNDINWKEWLYFSVSGKRWRIGPLPGTNNWVIQELKGTDWKNQSHWGEAAGGAEHTFWGGEQDSE